MLENPQNLKILTQNVRVIWLSYVGVAKWLTSCPIKAASGLLENKSNGTDFKFSLCNLKALKAVLFCEFSSLGCVCGFQD